LADGSFDDVDADSALRASDARAATTTWYRLTSKKCRSAVRVSLRPNPSVPSLTQRPSVYDNNLTVSVDNVVSAAVLPDQATIGESSSNGSIERTLP